MRPKAEWAIDSEAVRARGIIVLVKSNYYKGNKGRCKESTIRGHRKKSEPQMGFEPTTLRVLDRML